MRIRYHDDDAMLQIEPTTGDLVCLCPRPQCGARPIPSWLVARFKFLMAGRSCCFVRDLSKKPPRHAGQALRQDPGKMKRIV